MNQQEQNKLNKQKWAKNNPMSVKISLWKNKLKLISPKTGEPLSQEEWEELYHRWVECENCECCGKIFDPPKKSFNDKQLDHCHKTRFFRNFLCNKCNKIRAYVDNDYQTIMKLMSM